MAAGRQSRIPVPKPQLANPSEYNCDWCGDTATERHEIKRKKMGTQQFVYTCNEHREYGRQATSTKPRNT